MAISYSLYHLMISYLFIITAVISSADAGGSHHEVGFMPAKPTCQGGSIGECMERVEFDVDSELNRRILATKHYISYGSLQRNTVPCSRRGVSYYNCKPGAQVNPYIRGCSTIARCRG